MVAGVDLEEGTVAVLLVGILRSNSVRPTGPPWPVATRSPRGLGLRLLKLPIGLAKPLLAGKPGLADAGGAGATTATSAESSRVARTEAAESRTEGTECSRCSVPFALGILWGLWWAWEVGEGQTRGSMSRSKMAEDEERLEKKHVSGGCSDKSKQDKHRGRGRGDGGGRARAQTDVLSGSVGRTLLVGEMCSRSHVAEVCAVSGGHGFSRPSPAHNHSSYTSLSQPSPAH